MTDAGRDDTVSRGDHDRIVKRPPKRKDANNPDAVERWECLDCGLDVQCIQGVGTVFTEQSCPPQSSDQTIKERWRPTEHVDPPEEPDTFPPAYLNDDLRSFAEEIAKEYDVQSGVIAAECKNLLDYSVDPENLKGAIRRAAERGSYS